MATEDKVLNGSGLAHLTGKIKDAIADKSEVSVSATGTATDEVGYITIDGVEKKIAGGGGSSLQNILDGSETGSVRTVGTQTSIGQYAFAEGYNTKASGQYSHAEGNNTEATGWHSHAEGRSTKAEGNYSHAEGDTTRATGSQSHAEGFVTTASRSFSHAEGWRTGAISDYQHVQGKANVQDSRSVFADIVGNGTSESARSNASALDWDGNLYISGKVYQDCTDYSTNSSGLVTPGCGGTPVGGGGGSSYTFSNGLTEDTDTHVVSWDLNSNISKNGTKYLNIAPVSLNQNANISIFGGIMDTMPDAGRNICIGDNNRIGWDGNSTSCFSFMTGGGTHRNSGSGNVSIGGSGKIDSNYTSAIGYGIKQTGNKRSNFTFKNIFGNFNIDDTTDQYQFIIGNGTADNARSNALTVDWSGNVQASGAVIASNIPAPPSTDGEYNLHCSIVNGQVIYSWEAAQNATYTLTNDELTIDTE